MPPRRLASGVLQLGRETVKPEIRFLRLQNGLTSCVKEWQPELLALEAAFFGRNARSALRLGEARGVVMLTAANAGVPILEIPPAVVKRRVAGKGNADKEMIAHMVTAHLREEVTFQTQDESDACAIALCALIHDLAPQSPSARANDLPPGAYEQ